MAQTRQTRTIHTLVIDLQDDLLSGIEEGDEVEVMLVSRTGRMTKKLSYTDIHRLMRDLDGRY